jgi:hypothetical protein
VAYWLLRVEFQEKSIALKVLQVRKVMKNCGLRIYFPNADLWIWASQIRRHSV